MNTKTILEVTVATTVVAVLGISLAPGQRSFILSKLKAATSDLIHDLASIIRPEITSPVGPIPQGGEITSELIEIDQYETYSSH